MVDLIAAITFIRSAPTAINQKNVPHSIPVSSSSNIKHCVDEKGSNDKYYLEIRECVTHDLYLWLSLTKQFAHTTAATHLPKCHCEFTQ